MAAKALYCSTTCREAEMVRSVRTCPECGQRWHGEPETDAYCNGAWVLCKRCSDNAERCVVCGENVKASA